MDPHFFTRLSTVDDVPALVALVNSAYRGDSSRAGWTTEADLLGGIRIDAARLKTAVSTPGQAILVNEADGEIIACVHLQRTGETAYLGMLTTKPVRQGSGVGRKMIAAAERWVASEWGSREMHMTVLVQREELLAWYYRCGYERTGERKPFPYGDERWGLPTRSDLAFYVLRKRLAD
jgi:ribosomal protein S18 acetylase RimI-like enzyme